MFTVRRGPSLHLTNFYFMTLSPWIIYLWGIADNISSLFEVSAIATVITAVVLFLRAICEGESLKPGTVTAIVALCFGAFWVVTPSSKTVAVMVVAPAIVNSEPIQKDLPELYKAAKDALLQTLSSK